jgi:tmRNA-binding protein
VFHRSQFSVSLAKFADVFATLNCNISLQDTEVNVLGAQRKSFQDSLALGGKGEISRTYAELPPLDEIDSDSAYPVEPKAHEKCLITQLDNLKISIEEITVTVSVGDIWVNRLS